MNFGEKIINTLSKNLGYTVVLVLSVILFVYFSDGIIPGAITAFSALVGYACVLQLAREYKHNAAPRRTTPAKKVNKKK